MLQGLLLQLRPGDIYATHDLLRAKALSLLHLLRVLDSPAAHILLRVLISPVAALSHKSHQGFLGDADAPDSKKYQKDEECPHGSHNSLKTGRYQAADKTAAAAGSVILSQRSVRLGAHKELDKAAQRKQHKGAGAQLYHRPAASQIGLVEAHGGKNQHRHQISGHAEYPEHNAAQESSECADEPEIAQEQQRADREGDDDRHFCSERPAVIIRFLLIYLRLPSGCPCSGILLRSAGLCILFYRFRFLCFPVSGCHCLPLIPCFFFYQLKGPPKASLVQFQYTENLFGFQLFGHSERFS